MPPIGDIILLKSVKSHIPITFYGIKKNFLGGETIHFKETDLGISKKSRIFAKNCNYSAP